MAHLATSPGNLLGLLHVSFPTFHPRRIYRDIIYITYFTLHPRGIYGDIINVTYSTFFSNVDVTWIDQRNVSWSFPYMRRRWYKEMTNHQCSQKLHDNIFVVVSNCWIPLTIGNVDTTWISYVESTWKNRTFATRLSTWNQRGDYVPSS